MKYKIWEEEVLKSLTELKSKLDNNSKSKELYNGFYIWDSKFIKNPEIMFIGINPGDGNPNNNKNIEIKPSKQMSYLEYLDNENPNYNLARETVDVFERIGYNRKEIRNIFNNKSIKTNFHYIITKKESDIKKCLNNLEPKEFNNYWMQSYNWTGELIKIVKPKIIICEGKSVFDTIKDYEDFTSLNWINDCGFLVRDDGIIVIGYSRTFSNIKNKNELSKLIKKYIKNE